MVEHSRWRRYVKTSRDGGRPAELTVADVAYRWGFPHLGRFAAAYRAGYGMSPAETLREGSGARSASA